MKVYVAVHGVYSSQNVGGVYDTPERAMADSPGDVWTRHEYRHGNTIDAAWENNRDWDDAVRIEPFELVTEGPTRAADKAGYYRDTPDGRHTEWVEIPVDSSDVSAG